jgi:adenosylcobinamide-GDP ribazoletransferase
MRSLLAAVALLTRLPVARHSWFDPQEVGRGFGWFPLIGALLGAIYALAAAALRGHLPAAVIAMVVAALDAMLTGALHFDGLADAADGFGGGKDREDVLRIMRDHNIGSFGATALILCIALKVTAYGLLLQHAYWWRGLILTPALGRWPTVVLASALPYARKTESVVREVGRLAVFGGTISMAIPLGALQMRRGWAAAAAVVLVTGAFGLYCRRRIGGITGDTLGANVELCECAALLVLLWV